MNFEFQINVWDDSFNEHHNHYYYKVFLEKYPYNIKMLYFDKIDVSESIDVNQTSSSKECISCHYWYF